MAEKNVSTEHGDSNAAPLIDSSVDATISVIKWLVPSLAALFGIVGYVIEAAHSSFLGGGITGSSGADYIGSAADFAYDLPTIAIDLMLMCLKVGNQQRLLPLSGHGGALLMFSLLASVALCLTWSLKLGRASWRRFGLWIPPLVLVILLACKFILWDAPLLRIENVIVADGVSDDSVPGDIPATKSGLPLDLWIQNQADALWIHMACSRNPKIPPGDNPAVNCPAELPKDRQLVEGEFAVRFVACIFIALLSWSVLRDGSSRWRTILVIFSLTTLLTLPYAYGKLLKPTVFEFGRVDLVSALSETLSKQGYTDQPFGAIILARRSNAVDLLIEGLGKCAGKKVQTYLVTKVWSVSNSQVMSIKEIFRLDVIGWKLGHQQSASCSPPLPPGVDL